WRTWGQGPRRAVGIHAGLLQSGAWERVAACLPAGLGLLAFDMPGHGRSGPWDEARDYMDQTVAAALGLIADAPVDLLGHSFGAVAALRIASERPDLVRSLVLYEPVFFAAAEARGTDTRAPNAGFAAALAAGDREEAARCFTEVWGAASAGRTRRP
ncbi:MAG: alpha/beta hydrolase, partial [Paracoccaceae bacterium]|nr:alpha/beta hydrolase [Paracoccaceae bacterium]